MGASVVAIAAMAAPALAQTGGAPADQGNQAQVTVIAQHTTTRLQKIPVAVSVFTSATRDRTGIATVQDVTNFAPGFVYSTVTVNAGMRGVTRLTYNVTDDSRVVAYEDEFFVYSPYNLGESSLFNSQEQIQRGPQNVGGRNSEGGSIDMIAVRPTDHPYAEVRATIANYGAYEVEGAASDQIAPGLDARVAGYWSDQTQGYFRNVEGLSSEGGKTEQWQIQGAIDWKPSSNFDLYARAYGGTWTQDPGGPGTNQGPTELGSWDETNLSDANGPDGALIPNASYGYAALVPAAAAGAAANPANGFELPIAATLRTPGIFNNPATLSATSPLAAEETRTEGLQNFDSLNYIATYHFPNMDLKYIGGVQGYDYTLEGPVAQTDITSFTLPGSAFGIRAGEVAGLEAALTPVVGAPTADAIANSLPPASTLTVDTDATFLFLENDWYTSHELYLQSTDQSPLQWTVGGIYFFQQYSQPLTAYVKGQPQFSNPVFEGAGPLGALPPFLTAAPANPSREYAFQDYQFDNTEWAGYGQVSYKVTDDVKLTGNLRYTWDEKDGQEEERLLAFAPGGLAPLYGAATPLLDITSAEVCLTGTPNTVAHPTNCTTGPLATGVKSVGKIVANGNAVRQDDGTSNAVTGGAGIEWTPTPDIFTYFRYSRGYAPLSFNAGFVSSNPEVAPESLNAYELGYKQTFGRQLSVQAALYYYDYENIQTPISVSVGGLLEGQFVNIPKAESEGLELEGVWTPTRDLIFTLSYSYDYTAFLTGCTLVGGLPTAGSACLVNTQDPLGTAPGAKVVPGQTGPDLDQSIKGNPIPEAPRNKIALSGAYTFHFDPGNLTLSAVYSWRDTQGGSLFNTPYNTSPAWWDVDLRAIWSGNHDRYEIIGFIKNVGNTVQYQSGPASAGLFGNGVSATTTAKGLDYVESYGLNPPRTFGVEVRYKFF
jgi:iron complex outermembrane receptor protein